MSAFELPQPQPQHRLAPNPNSNDHYKPNLPLKKRPFQGPMQDDDDESPPPTKLRRLVASYWRMSRLHDAAGWMDITRGPPASGSYLYTEQYPEDEHEWQQRVLEWNSAVTQRTQYQAHGIFVPMPDDDMDRKPSPVRRAPPEEEEEEEDMAPTTTLMGPSRRTTAAFELLPLRPVTGIPLTTLRRIPGADSLSYSTDTVDTASEGLRRPLFRNSFNMLPHVTAEDDDDDELLVMEPKPAPTTPHLPSFASVTPSPHFFLHPPRLVRPTPRPPSATSNAAPTTHRRHAPRPHVFRPVVRSPPAAARPFQPRHTPPQDAAEEPEWEHPLRPPHSWQSVTSAFAPGRRPNA
jgi:hypothetical protein